MRKLKRESPSLIQRYRIYFTEMFPVLLYFPFALIQYFCLSLVIQGLNNSLVIIDSYAVVGAVSTFFLMLMLRTFDDIKDYALDKRIFPQRPIPRGDVNITDVYFLSGLSILVLLVINIFFAPASLVVFSVVLLYALLTFKWFFAEKFHRDHVYFTMFTHQPLPFMVNFYLIHTAMASGNVYEKFSWIHVFVLLLFSLPISAWEISRKTRSADMETEYETFSRFIGVRMAALLPLLLFTIVTGTSFYIGRLLTLNCSFYLISGISLISVAFFYIRFMVNPINKNNVLKNVAMTYSGLLIANLLIHLLISLKISW